MTRSEEYVSRFEKILEPFLEQHGLELFDAEYVKEGADMFLRAYIDKEGGVTVDDCELVSRYMSDELDREDFIPEAYMLEVSSPGLGRQLKKDKHLEKSIGRDVDIKLYKAVDREKEFTGRLISFDADRIVLGGDGGEEIELERKNIALIRLSFDF